MPIDPDDLDLSVLIALTGTAINEHVLARTRAAGFPDIRVSHGYVFQHLIEGSPTVSELAERLGMTQQGASKAVLELEQLGYVERHPDAHDSRVRRVRLTDRGHDCVRAGRKARRALEKQVKLEVGERAIKAAREVLLEALKQTDGWDAIQGRSVRPPSE
jgi:DNA-binding MarR family transcriptional regulator